MDQFLDQETLNNRKPPSVKEVNILFGSGSLSVPPLRIAVIEGPTDRHLGPSYDGILEATWGQETSRYVFEYKTQSTPKTLASAIYQTKGMGYELKLKPMVIVPYLNEDKLAELERQNVSGIDLCGNAVVLGDRFRVWSAGRINRFTTSAPIKNVFRGTSSLFARCFLIQPSFPSLAGLQRLALQRTLRGWEEQTTTTILSKGTASKVVSSLEEELIISREGDTLRLIDPLRLLRRLRESYVSIGAGPIEAKTALPSMECWRRLREAGINGELKAVTTGIGSASHYGALSTESSIVLYVSNAAAALWLLEASPSRAFPNLKIVETNNEMAYFDARMEGDQLWASPIQTWIELATGGPRERDAARTMEAEWVNGMVGRP